MPISALMYLCLFKSCSFKSNSKHGVHTHAYNSKSKKTFRSALHRRFTPNLIASLRTIHLNANRLEVERITHQSDSFLQNGEEDISYILEIPELYLLDEGNNQMDSFLNGQPVSTIYSVLY